MDRINRLILESLNVLHKQRRKHYYPKDELAIYVYNRLKRMGKHYSIETVLRRLRMLERQGYLDRFYRGKVPNRRAFYFLLYRKIEYTLRRLETGQ